MRKNKSFIKKFLRKKNRFSKLNMLAKRKNYRKPVQMSQRKSLQSLLCYYSLKNPIGLLHFTQGSNKLCYWYHESDCGCLHEWEACIQTMTLPSTTIGCAKCSNRVGTPCCDKKSLIGNQRFQEIKHELNSDLDPSKHYPSSHTLVWWKHKSNFCDCIHEWRCEINARIVIGSNCPNCTKGSTAKKPCCIVGTVASDPRLMKEWDYVKNTVLELDPSKLFLACGTKAHWKCDKTCQGQIDCKHEWFAEIRSRKKAGCPHCVRGGSGNHNPCCRNKSLAADIYSEIMLEFDYNENKNIDPRSLFPCCDQNIDWICKKSSCGCEHKWPSSLNDRIQTGSSIPKSGCPYCSTPPRKICCKNHPRSLLQWGNKEKLQCIVNDKNCDLAMIMISSNSFLKFKCIICYHLFFAQVNHVTHITTPSWCHFCSHQRVCGISTCTTCKMKCQMGTCFKIARKQTRMTRVWYCESCFLDCVARDPNETLLMYRAKVSLEIYILCEIQRLDTCGIWSIPTTWDCAVFYGLSFKPDLVFIFDQNNSLYETCGACKINSREIGYILQVEIIEESRKTHSEARNPSDSQRELEIRQTFHGIPIGFLYITVAHTKHFNAHPDDVFFHKVDQEYQLLSHRIEAFQNRVQLVLETLFEMFENHEDGTRFIGH